MYILLLALAVLPGLLISYLIIRMDRYDREPRLHLALSFFGGMLLTFPVLVLEEWAVRAGWDQPDRIGATLAFAFIAVALVEEGMKLILLLVYPYLLRKFNEPMDGIVYSVMIGMGFATLENVLYAETFGLETILIRAMTAVPAHGAFSIILGYFVGLAKFSGEERGRLILRGFLLAVLLHGAYDFFILQSLFQWLIVLAIVVLAVSIYYARRMVIDHQAHSPFRDREEEREV
jgi:RsiW-degrading membrane proteinase PrsW (M82 family)